MSDKYSIDNIRRNAGAGSGIKNAKGTLITLTDASHDLLPRLNIYGRSTQDGVPSVDKPIPILPGSKTKDIPTIRVSNKNIIAETIATVTSNGVTCTNNGDGTYTLNGTATANTYFHFFNKIRSPYIGTYKIVGAPEGGGSGKYGIVVGKWNAAGTDWSAIANDFGSGANVTFDTENLYTFSIGIYKGFTASDLVFKPMLTADLTATAEDFVKHEGAEAFTDYWYRGIPVSSGGNYTDESGQQWLCDTIEINEDGTCNYVQNIGVLTLDGTTNYFKASGNYLNLMGESYGNAKWIPGGSALCSKLARTAFTCNDNSHFIYTIPDYLKTAGYTYTNVATLNNDLKGSVILYALATPKKLEMNWLLEDVAKLHSYDPYTTITADGAFVDVDYVPNYIANDTRYFQINGIPSSDFDIQLQGAPKIGEIEPVYEQTHVQGRNGDIVRPTGEYRNRDINLECFHISRYPQEKMLSIEHYLLKNQGYVNLWFPDDYDHYWKAAVTKTGERATRNNWLNPFGISFTAMPQSFLVEGGVIQTVYTGKSTDAPDVRRPFTITNPGNQGGKPLLKITGKGEIIIDAEAEDQGYLHFIIPSSGVLWFDFYTGNAYTDEEKVITSAIEYHDKIVFPAGETTTLRVEAQGTGSYVTKIECVGGWYDI